MLLIELPQTAQTAPIQLNRWQQKKKKGVGGVKSHRSLCY